MQLLFVPAGGGVVGYLGVREDAVPIAVSVTGPWFLGWICRWLDRSAFLVALTLVSYQVGR